MKCIEAKIQKKFYQSLDLTNFSYDVCILGKSMIQVFAPASTNMFTYSFLQFIGEFCKNNELIYYVTSQDDTGRVYVVLHRF